MLLLSSDLGGIGESWDTLEMYFVCERNNNNKFALGLNLVIRHLSRNHIK